MSTDQEILDKVNAGQALTPEEQREVMSEAHGDFEQHDDSEQIKAEREQAEDTATENAAAEKPKTTEQGSESAKTPEATKTGEAGKAGPEGKATDTAAADKKTAEEQASDAKVKEQLEKPDGQEDLAGLTARERGLFYELRHERSKRQELERERDTLKFEKLKAKLEKDKEEEPAEDDFLTHKQVKERVGQIAADLDARHRRSMVGLWHREGVREHSDFAVVLDLGEALVEASPEHQAKIREAYESGDNPALVTYDLIKNDPKLADLAAKAGLILQDGVWRKPPAKSATPVTEPTKADAEALKKAKQVQANADKTVTTGSAGGGEGGGGDEWTAERLRAMSDAEFAKLPAAKRHELLERFG